MYPTVYACYNRNKVDRLLSSSGGFFPLIAKYTISNNGVVYAACYNNLRVEHRRITNDEDIKKAQGSKYVASFLGNTFSEVLSDLNNNRLVLFTGTPCQCAGLLSYIQIKKADESKLILLDFVCHGVPSEKVWNAYIQALAKRGVHISNVNMRDKSSGWSYGKYSWKLTSQAGDQLFIPVGNVSYMKGFLSNLYLRPSCYNCKFKGINRYTDFTIGDYWGVWEYQTHMDDNEGTSIVIIHTNKANKMFSELKASMAYDIADITNVIHSNPSLIESAVLNNERKRFFRLIETGHDFIKTVNYISKKNEFKKKINKLVSILYRK